MNGKPYPLEKMTRYLKRAVKHQWPLSNGNQDYKEILQPYSLKDIALSFGNDAQKILSSYIGNPTADTVPYIEFAQGLLGALSDVSLEA